jgi:hypothetical protein
MAKAFHYQVYIAPCLSRGLVNAHKNKALAINHLLTCLILTFFH